MTDEPRRAAKIAPDFLKGVIPIVVTPFDDAGRVDAAAFDAEIEHLLAGGAPALSTGLATEIMSLDEAERGVLLARLSAVAQGRARLIAGSGGQTAEEAIGRAQAALALGFEALLVTPPQGLQDEAALFAYYAAVGHAVRAPMIVQDAAQMTGVRFSPELLGRLAREVEWVVAVKVESPPTPPRFAEIALQDTAGVALLGGMGGRFAIDEWRRGAIGTMPGPGTGALFFFDVWRLLDRGEEMAALKLFHRYFPLLHWSSVEFGRFLYLEKELLRRAGVFRSSAVRLPTRRPEPLEIAELDMLFELTGVAGENARRG